MQLRTRRDQSFHFTKSRAAAFNYIWELVNLPSPVREGSSSHLRGKPSSLADNKQLCRWQQCSDIKPIDTTSWQVHTLSAEWEFSNVFCLLQMWTDVWRKKMTLLQMRFFYVLLSSPCSFDRCKRGGGGRFAKLAPMLPPTMRAGWLARCAVSVPAGICSIRM